MAAPGGGGPTGVDGIAVALERRLGGRVSALHRLSGGASRTTWAFLFSPPGGDPVPLILQVRRRGAAGSRVAGPSEATLLRAAGRAGVPVPEVVAAGPDDGLGSPWIIVERVEGESIARRILRDEEYRGARRVLVGQCGQALARIHAVPAHEVPELDHPDQLDAVLQLLRAAGQSRPVLELAARRLEATRPAPAGRTVVHGDFRMGNLLVDRGGLRAVLDWELAHLGDPLEDLGWFCVPSWRFGSPLEAGGVGRLEELVEAYEAASGEAVDRAALQWWQILGALQWAVICMLQAAAHSSGVFRSVELAAIGRRVSESEWDLLGLLGIARPGREEPSGLSSGSATDVTPDLASPFGDPSAVELVEAVREFLAEQVVPATEGGLSFHARVAGNALGVAAREVELGPAVAHRHRGRLRQLGCRDDRQLIDEIRLGARDDCWRDTAEILAESVGDQLLIDNPRYLEGPGPEPER